MDGALNEMKSYHTHKHAVRELIRKPSLKSTQSEIDKLKKDLRIEVRKEREKS